MIALLKTANRRPRHSPSPRREGELNLCRSRGDEALIKKTESTITDDAAISRTIVPQGQSRIAQRFNAGLSRLWNLKSRRDDRILSRKGPLSPVKLCKAQLSNFFGKNIFCATSPTSAISRIRPLCPIRPIPCHGPKFGPQYDSLFEPIRAYFNLFEPILAPQFFLVVPAQAGFHSKRFKALLEKKLRAPSAGCFVPWRLGGFGYRASDTSAPGDFAPSSQDCLWHQLLLYTPRARP